MYTGPHLIKDNLVFGYDTGYGVADNNTATRFYPGEPTTNAVPLSTFINTSNWTGAGWSGTIAVSADYDNTLELTSTNGWRTWRVNTGITSGGTVTVSYEYKMKTLATTNVYMLNLNGDQLGSYVNGLGNISAADTQDLSTWKTFTSSWTANSNSNLAIGLRGADGQALTDTIYVRKLQVELKGQPSPFTATSRSSTQSLIDLKRTTNIDVSNVSFDSTGQPEFDGTDDYIPLTGILNNEDIGASTAYTVDMWLKPGVYSSRMPFSTGQNGNNRIYYWTDNGLNTWRIGNYTSTSGHGTLPTVGTWYNTTLVINGTNITVYLNGEEDYTGSYTTFNTQHYATFGRHGASTSYYYTGKIAVARLHERVLSADEVKQNYNAQKNRFNI